MALGSFFYDNAMASWIYDKNSLKFIEVNSKCLCLYGYTQAEFLEKLTVIDLVPREDIRIVTRYLKSINNTSPMLVPQTKKDGTGFQALVFVKPVEFYGRDCAYVTTIDNAEILLSKPLTGSLTTERESSFHT